MQDLINTAVSITRAYDRGWVIYEDWVSIIGEIKDKLRSKGKADVADDLGFVVQCEMDKVV